MKKVFYKNWNILIQTIIIFNILDLILFSFIFIDTNDYNFNLIIISLLSFFVIVEVLVFIIGCKIFMSRIEITNEGLKWKLFNKELKTILWEDIICIKKCYIASTQSLCISLTSNVQLTFNVNKKILKSLINLCNDTNLIRQMEKVNLIF